MYAPGHAPGVVCHVNCLSATTSHKQISLNESCAEHISSTRLHQRTVVFSIFQTQMQNTGYINQKVFGIVGILGILSDVNEPLVYHKNVLLLIN